MNPPAEGYERLPLRGSSHGDHVREHARVSGSELEPNGSGQSSAELIEEALDRVTRIPAKLNIMPSMQVLETFFSPIGGRSMTRDQLREVVPAIRIQLPSDNLAFYPNAAPASANSGDLTSDGWRVRASRGPDQPSWAWALDGGCTFLDRQDYWDDLPLTWRRVLGTAWLAYRICMVLHLLARMAQTLRFSDAQRLLVRVRLTGTQERFLQAEGGLDHGSAHPALREEVQSLNKLTEGDLRRRYRGIAAEILKDVAWQMERTTVTDHEVNTWLDAAIERFGEATLYPIEPNPTES